MSELIEQITVALYFIAFIVGLLIIDILLFIKKILKEIREEEIK